MVRLDQLMVELLKLFGQLSALQREPPGVFFERGLVGVFFGDRLGEIQERHPRAAHMTKVRLWDQLRPTRAERTIKGVSAHFTKSARWWVLLGASVAIDCLGVCHVPRVDRAGVIYPQP